MDREAIGDFLAMDIRQALHVLGEITTDDLLASIFGKYLYRKVTSQNNPIFWFLVRDLSRLALSRQQSIPAPEDFD